MHKTQNDQPGSEFYAHKWFAADTASGSKEFSLYSSVLVLTGRAKRSKIAIDREPLLPNRTRLPVGMEGSLEHLPSLQVPFAGHWFCTELMAGFLPRVEFDADLEPRLAHFWRQDLPIGPLDRRLGHFSP